MDLKKASLVKYFRKITNNCNLPQSQQLTQATDIRQEEIRMSINLPYVKETSEKLQRILRSHKIRLNFYTEITLRKLLCKPKGPVATEDKYISFMTLTVVTVKQFSSVNINGL